MIHPPVQPHWRRGRLGADRRGVHAGLLIMKRLLKNAVVVSLCALSGQAWPADLVQILRAAFANDAQYASARATRDAGLETWKPGNLGG